jgi:prepilin-type N-terminal cleavage/methylation domain-containing protein
MMNIAMAVRRSSQADEAGFSLIEVLVAISLITIVATASATLVLNGIAAGATVERRQVAVTIASGAMESVSAQSVNTTAATGVSALYTGRTYADLHAAWTANSTAAGIPQSYEAWDPTAVPASIPSLPITSTVTRAGTDYSVETLIGTCIQPTAGGDCGKIAGYLGATPPATVPSNFTTLIRVVVLVKWTAGEKCAASGCSYVASTLIDPHLDLEWVTHG